MVAFLPWGEAQTCVSQRVAELPISNNILPLTRDTRIFSIKGNTSSTGIGQASRFFQASLAESLEKPCFACLGLHPISNTFLPRLANAIKILQLVVDLPIPPWSYTYNFFLAPLI